MNEGDQSKGKGRSHVKVRHLVNMVMTKMNYLEYYNVLYDCWKQLILGKYV